MRFVFPAYRKPAAILLALTFPIIVSGQQPAETPLPDAAKVALRIGEFVTFQDEVTAHSRSRTREGSYLSFGAPYPDQVLSVWIPDEVKYKLRWDETLVGRNVRISGKVEASRTGPIINLNSPQQFALLPADVTTLSKAKLDGKTDRGQFMAAIKEAFAQREFETLEQLAWELMESKERFTDGTWMLDAFFRALSFDSTSGDAAFAAAQEAFTKWRAQFPESAAAIITTAGFHRALASKFRNASEDEDGFARELANARRLLESYPQAKQCPHYFVVIQRIAIAQEWPREEFFRLFDEAVARAPDYYGIYFTAAYYLRRHGAPDEWEEFAEEQRRRVGGAAGDLLYTRMAWSVFQHPRQLRDSNISWETMAAGFDELIRRHPDSRYLKSAYARFAWVAGDRERLRKALEAVEYAPDMSMWTNQENVDMAIAFINSGQAAATPTPAIGSERK